jgi:hypothetical protein
MMVGGKLVAVLSGLDVDGEEALLRIRTSTNAPVIDTRHVLREHLRVKVVPVKIATTSAPIPERSPITTHSSVDIF